MFDPVIDFLQNLSPQLKAVVSVVVSIIGVACVLKPAANTLVSFSKADWMKGIMWLIAGIVVIAISIGIIAVTYGLGKKQGDSIKSELGYDNHNTEYVKDISQF